MREAGLALRDRAPASLRALAEAEAELLEPIRGCRVLLVGEEEGILARLLVERHGAEVTWLDADADPHRLPGARDGFDRVAARLAPDGAADLTPALAFWAGLLRPGGRLVVVFTPREEGPFPAPGRPAFFPHTRKQELLRAAERAGLSRGRVTVIPRRACPPSLLPPLFRGAAALPCVPALFLVAEKSGER